MSRREPCRSGFEQDAIHARHRYCYTDRPGVAAAAKRDIRRRERRQGRDECKHDTENTQ